MLEVAEIDVGLLGDLGAGAACGHKVDGTLDRQTDGAAGGEIGSIGRKAVDVDDCPRRHVLRRRNGRRRVACFHLVHLTRHAILTRETCGGRLARPVADQKKGLDDQEDRKLELHDGRMERRRRMVIGERASEVEVVVSASTWAEGEKVLTCLWVTASGKPICMPESSNIYIS